MKIIKLKLRMFFGESGCKTVSTTIYARNVDQEAIKRAAKAFAQWEHAKMEICEPGTEAMIDEVDVSIVTVEDTFSVSL